MSLDLYFYERKCDHCGRADELEGMNITHNLAKMAGEAGIYGILWRPEENGIDRLEEMYKPLVEAVGEMKDNPERYKALNAPNGWGTYDQFVPWLERLIDLCEKHPGAFVRASR